jgi:hypothetical protein
MAKINQKYFGNRNIGTGGQQLTVDDNGNVITPADDKIGGEGIAAINFPNDAGSFAGNSNVPVLTVVPAIPAPTLPGGVQATYTILYEAYSVSTGAGKSGLNVGDTFGHTSLPGLVAKVTSTSGSNAVFSCTVAGASVSNALTLSQIPQDTIGFTLTKIAGSGSATTFLTDVLFHVKSVTITEKGSGYIGTETLPSFTKPGTTNGNVPVGVLAFTTDSGAPGSSTNQENAILAYAKTTSGGTSQVADIIKQRGTKRFKVKTADGTAICSLKAGAVSAVGEMTIGAVDDTNGTYYVTKIGGRRCTIVQNNGTAFATNSSVPWVFSKSDPAYNAATTVIIANA